MHCSHNNYMLHYSSYAIKMLYLETVLIAFMIPLFDKKSWISNLS